MSAALSLMSEIFASGSSSNTLTGSWGDVAYDAETIAPVAPVVSTPVAMPYGMSVVAFKKAHAAAVTHFGNKVTNSKTPTYQYLTSTETAVGAIANVVGAPTYVDGRPVHGTSDVDKFWCDTSRSNDRVGVCRNIPNVTIDAAGVYQYKHAHQLFALFLHGTDVARFDGCEHLESLAHYLPSARPIVEKVTEGLRTLEGAFRDSRYEVVDEVSPLLLRIRVVSPAPGPLVSVRLDNGRMSAPAAVPVVPRRAAVTPSAAAAPSYATALTPTAPVARPSAAATTSTPTAPIAITRESPVFDAERLKTILSYLSSLNGRSAEELRAMHALGVLPAVALNLLL